MRRDKARQGKVACETLPGWIYTRTRAFIAACISELKIIFKFNLQTLNVWLKLKCLVKSLKKQNLSESKQSSERKDKESHFSLCKPNPPILACCVRFSPHLEGFDEGPQQGPNPFPARQQLHQPHHAEQPEEGDGDPGVLFRVLQSLLVGFGVFFLLEKKTQDAWEHMQIDREMKQMHTHTHIYTRTHAHK